jgi:Trk K+ transport system NAD-binding subunit
VALTAVDQAEADLFHKAGADVVFRPFLDAAEQAADALAHAMDCLPCNLNWPITFLETRVPSDASIVGRTIRDIPLRSSARVSILAVSRSGRIHYEPGPDFRIFPGDRLVVMGPPEGLREAEQLLNQLEARRGEEDAERFEISEVSVARGSSLSGYTLAELTFRQTYGVTVIGIRRGDELITAVGPTDALAAGDHLIVIGVSQRVKALSESEPL